MAKHAAPATGKRRTPKHAATQTASKRRSAVNQKRRFSLPVPSCLKKLRMPQMPDLSRLKKLKKLDMPDGKKLRALLESVAALGLSEGEKSSRFQRRKLAFNKDQVYLTAGGALLFFLLWLLPTAGWVRFALYLLPAALLGFYTALDALSELLARRFAGRNWLMLLCALALLLLQQPREAVFVLFMHRVFLLLESYIYEKKQRELDEIRQMPAAYAIREGADGLERVATQEIQSGDRVFVQTGEKVPVDGVMTEGLSSVEVGMLTGGKSVEDVGVNSYVCAGSQSTNQPLRLRALRSAAESTAERLAARSKRAAEGESSRLLRLRGILSYLPTALLLLAAILAFAMSLKTGLWQLWLTRCLLLLALGGSGDLLLGARLSYFDGVCRAAREGVFFADGDGIDRLAGSDMMIFSKTGTVTEGRYQVEGVYPVDFEEKDLLTIAALAECQSVHPIARALREACGLGVHTRADITLLEETPGRGIHTLFAGKNVYVGNSTLMMEHNIYFDVPVHKGTVLYVAVDNKFAGCIVLSDRVRDGAFDSIEELRSLGIRATVMLTGDVRSMARPIASSLNFDMVKCELSDEAKLEALNYLKNNKGNAAAVSYVSCKAEDLELLSEADVGIGFAALTEEEPMDEADVLIYGSSFAKIPRAMQLAKAIRKAGGICTYGMLALFALLALLGLLGAVSLWVALLLLLIGRLASMIYPLFFYR